MMAKNKKKQSPKNCSVISFLAQKLLLKALYENWQDVSAVQAAGKLEVSRMSITRCFDEIEVFGMSFLKASGRSRRFFAQDDKKSMWEEMRPLLRNPVIREFRPERKPDADLVLSGISAFAEYSMPGEDSYVTYTMGKDQVAASGLKSIREVPGNEEPVCIVQEVGYLLPFDKRIAVDPLSLTLMLSEEELEDPRVESCVNEMLEELVW